MRILLADDDPISCLMMRAMLTDWGYDVVVVRNGNEAWEVLSGQDVPHLAILDWVMPGMDGIEVCQHIRKAQQEPYIYVILLTSKGEKEDIVTGLNSGADDYITKPFDPHELRVRLRAGRRILDLQDQLIATRTIFQERATHDPLTGLWNRLAVNDLFVQELSRAKREKSTVTVAMADIDHFKAVNDTYGHMAGDAVLRSVADRMVATVRNYDRNAQYGGEEFLLVLTGCDTEKSLLLMERVRTSIAATPIDTSEGMIAVTISIGVTISTEDEASFDALIKRADMALYQAKQDGRNRVVLMTSPVADPPPALPACGEGEDSDVPGPTVYTI